MRSISALVVSLVLCAAWAVSPALALDLPTHGDVVLLDLNPTGELDVIPGFLSLPAFPNPVVPVLGNPIPPNLPATAAGVFQTGEFVNFWDSVARVYNPLHWENQIVNSNTTPMIFRVVFLAPPSCYVGGIVALPPGWGLSLEVIVKDVPEQGWWVWGTSWNGKPSVSVDTSVTENLFYDRDLKCCDYFWEFIEPPGWDPAAVPYVCWPYYPTFTQDTCCREIRPVPGSVPIIRGKCPYPTLLLILDRGYHRLAHFQQLLKKVNGN